MRALAIEFFWSVALFCSAPMELGFGSSLARSFFKLAAAPRSTMSSPLPYCRTNQTGSDVDVIGMITASARHRWTYRRRNGTKRKFFNGFSRARACACAQGGVRSGCVSTIDGVTTLSISRGSGQLENERAGSEPKPLLHRRRTEQSDGPEKLYCKRSHGQALIISEGPGSSHLTKKASARL